jgi:hypothetical protein
MVLSYTTVVIALLGIVAGYVTQAVNTGSFLGVITVPKAWLPYLTLSAIFLSAGVASIVAAPEKNGAAWFAALVASLVAIGGNVAGVTVKQHFDAYKRAPTPPANDNAIAEKKAA